MRSSFLAAAVFAAACGRGAVQPDLELREPIAPGPIAITNVNVITMASSEVLQHQTVLIADGRISAIGPDGAVMISTGTHRIDGSGRFLVPGLADMHVHVQRKDLHTYTSYGITTLRNMWGTPMLSTLPEDGRGGLTADSASPTIYSASPGFDGSPPEWPAGIMVDDASAARSAVASVATGHWISIKVYNQLSAATYDSIVTAAKDAHLPIVGHVPFSISVEHALASGQRSIEHLSGYDRALTNGRRGAFAWASVNRDALGRYAEMTRDAGTWNCPTSVVLGYIIRNASAATRDAAAEGRHAMIKALHDAGARLIAGTDAGIDLTAPGASLHDELDELVASGLSNYEALKAATVDAAVFLGVPGEFGTVTVGARADLLLIAGNPLEDLHRLRSPLGIVVRGRLFTPH